MLLVALKAPCVPPPPAFSSLSPLFQPGAALPPAVCASVLARPPRRATSAPPLPFSSAVLPRLGACASSSARAPALERAHHAAPAVVPMRFVLSFDAIRRFPREGSPTNCIRGAMVPQPSKVLHLVDTNQGSPLFREVLHPHYLRTGELHVSQRAALLIQLNDGWDAD